MEPIELTRGFLIGRKQLSLIWASNGSETRSLRWVIMLHSSRNLTGCTLECCTLPMRIKHLSLRGSGPCRTESSSLPSALSPSNVQPNTMQLRSTPNATAARSEPRDEREGVGEGRRVGMNEESEEGIRICEVHCTGGRCKHPLSVSSLPRYIILGIVVVALPMDT